MNRLGRLVGRRTLAHHHHYRTHNNNTAVQLSGLLATTTTSHCGMQSMHSLSHTQLFRNGFASKFQVLSKKQTTIVFIWMASINKTSTNKLLRYSFRDLPVDSFKISKLWLENHFQHQSNEKSSILLSWTISQTESWIYWYCLLDYRLFPTKSLCLLEC